jgi:DNA invertase Pin-like site-specific DNA recombinase
MAETGPTSTRCRILFETFIVAKLDRLARSIVHAANIIDSAHAQGWSLVVLDINLDLTMAGGQGDGVSREVQAMISPVRARRRSSQLVGICPGLAM